MAYRFFQPEIKKNTCETVQGKGKAIGLSNVSELLLLYSLLTNQGEFLQKQIMFCPDLLVRSGPGIKACAPGFRKIEANDSFIVLKR